MVQQLLFARPLDVLANHANYRCAIRPNLYHWKRAANRPPLQKSLGTLEKELNLLGGSGSIEYLQQYNPSDTVKLFFDVEWKQEEPIDSKAALERLDNDVIQPIITALLELTQKEQV